MKQQMEQNNTPIIIQNCNDLINVNFQCKTSNKYHSHAVSKNVNARIFITIISYENCYSNYMKANIYVIIFIFKFQELNVALL